jgi:hypothetical protein
MNIEHRTSNVQRRTGDEIELRRWKFDVRCWTFGTILFSCLILTANAAEPPKRVAAIVTVYHHNSHADVIVSRLLQTYTLDGKGKSPRLKLASLYTDQAPKNDISRRLAKEHGFPIFDTVAKALTLGTDALAVDGVLLVAEHGNYPTSKTGQTEYPKLKLFREIATVFERSGRVVPVFIDKHLADNWHDAKVIYDTCQKQKIPLMAGSSLPVLWRYPPADVERGTKLKEIVAVSYHTLDGYGFHALEMVQCLAERRGTGKASGTPGGTGLATGAYGETGVVSVQCLVDEAVWAAERRKVFDPVLLKEALSRLKRPPKGDVPLSEQVPHPVLWVIKYADGLQASVLTLNYAVGEWAVAWRDGEDKTQSTLFWTQEARPLMHFTYLVQGIDEMMQSGKPAWPAERTLLTSGVLDSLLISKLEGGKLIDTPHLGISYRSSWAWREPPPPPKGRPLDEQ